MKDIIQAKKFNVNLLVNLTVLKGIDVAIRKAEVVAITGPSGAGKPPYSTFGKFIVSRYFENTFLVIQGTDST